jgi:dihydrofolate reductase
MAKVVFGMTMSLDGFVNDRNGSVTPLYSLDTLPKQLLEDAIAATGAVVMGRRTFEMAEDPDTYADVYEFQVPIFVVTDRAPARTPKQNDRLRFTFVTDGAEAAIRQAKAAAGAKEVCIVGGPNLGQQLLRAGLVDELQLGIAPILLGAGLRLFEHLGDTAIQLEKVRLVDSGPRTDIWYRMVK